MTKKKGYKICKILEVVSITVGFIGFFILLGAAGTSDFETMTGYVGEMHSTWWFIKMSLLGFFIMFIGYVIDRFRILYKRYVRRYCK